MLKRHECDPVEPRASAVPDLDRQASLADAAGSDQGDQTVAVVAEPLEQRRDFPLAAYRVRVPSREMTGGVGRIVVGGDSCFGLTGRVEPLGEEDRQSASTSSASSAGVENDVYEIVSSSRIRP